MKRSRLTSVKQTERKIIRQAPSDIPERFRPVWRAAAEHMIRAGKYDHETDAPLLKLYIHSLDEAESMRQQVEAEGRVVPGSGGTLRAHPLLTPLNAARVTASKIASSLGLTPASRKQIATAVDNAATTEAPADPWAKAAKETDEARLSS